MSSMNYKAIDAGARRAASRSRSPQSWAERRRRRPDGFRRSSARPAVVEPGQRDLMEPRQPDGRRLSAGLRLSRRLPTGSFAIGASAYEKRGVAVTVPAVDPPRNCAQCNLCSFVCSARDHPSLYPHRRKRSPAAPEGITATMTRSRAVEGIDPSYKFTDRCFSSGLHGLRRMCVSACPTGRTIGAGDGPAGRSQPDHAAGLATTAVQQRIRKKPGMPFSETTVKGCQFKQPLLEFSGSCAGCAETSYARLITQMFGEQNVYFQRNRLLLHLGRPGCYLHRLHRQHRSPASGPAWSNSLFEDNAEHGYGMYLGQKVIRDQLIAKLTEMAESDKASEGMKKAVRPTSWPPRTTPRRTPRLSPPSLQNWRRPLRKAARLRLKILDKKQYLSKKSVWIFGGDGWAYDIGFGGLDHVLASGDNVNVFVFDTEMYSNTGGQASKASNIGEVCQFAAAGKASRQEEPC